MGVISQSKIFEHEGGRGSESFGEIWCRRGTGEARNVRSAGNRAILVALKCGIEEGNRQEFTKIRALEHCAVTICLRWAIGRLWEQPLRYRP